VSAASILACEVFMGPYVLVNAGSKTLAWGSESESESENQRADNKLLAGTGLTVPRYA
jgi:hypothetical protein